MNGLGGGAERVLADLTNGLVERGHDVGILTFDPPGESFYHLDHKVVRYDAAFNVPGTPTSISDFVISIPRIRAMVRSAQPQLIIPFMHSTFVPVAIATAGMRIRTIFSEHTDAVHYMERPLERLLTSLCQRTAKVSTIPSETARKSFPPNVANKYIVIPNPIDAQKFIVPNDKNPDQRRCILCVGRFDEFKGQTTLLRAFDTIREDFPEWKLKFVGDGPLRRAIEAEIAKLKVSQLVSLPGIVREMPSTYAECAFVAIPSSYESFGMVAVEAMASKKAVLAFDNCSGIREIVQHGKTGILVAGQGAPELRVKNLAEGMRQLMSSEKLRDDLGSAGPLAVEQFSLDEVLRRWESAFELALSDSAKYSALQATI